MDIDVSLKLGNKLLVKPGHVILKKAFSAGIYYEYACSLRS